MFTRSEPISTRAMAPLCLLQRFATLPSVSALQLKDLDLNLLVALDALLEDRNVTRAAQRLGISQSALSHRLRRLREELNDPLFVSSQTGLLPTPRAMAMAEALRKGLFELQRAVQQSPEFDPETAERAFRIAAVDQAEVAFLAGTLEQLSHVAPGMRIRLFDSRPDVVDRMERGEIDFLITVQVQERAVIRRLVLTEFDLVVVARQGHPKVHDGRISMADYAAAGHIVVSPHENSEPGFVEEILAAQGHTQRVMLRCPRFAGAPFVVAQSDFLLTTTRPFAEACARLMPVQTVTPPFESQIFPLCMYWHERDQDDPGHRWMRDFLVKEFERKRAGGPAEDHGA